MPATNASSERTFSTTNVISRRQRWRMDPIKLANMVLAKYNSHWWPSAEDIEAAPATQQDKCPLTMQEAEAIDEEAWLL